MILGVYLKIGYISNVWFFISGFRGDMLLEGCPFSGSPGSEMIIRAWMLSCLNGWNLFTPMCFKPFQFCHCHYLMGKTLEILKNRVFHHLQSVRAPSNPDVWSQTIKVWLKIWRQNIWVPIIFSLPIILWKFYPAPEECGLILFNYPMIHRRSTCFNHPFWWFGTFFIFPYI